MKYKILLISLIILLRNSLLLQTSAADDANNFCSSADGVLVPRNYNRTVVLGKNQHVEPDLQIYTNRRIECDGFLVEWHFVARNKLVYGLHLGVFRKDQDTFSVYRLINSTYIQLSVVRNFRGRPTWVSYKLAEPFEVKRGDYLAAWYERFDTPQKLLTVISGSVNGSEDDQQQNTFLVPMGNEMLKRDSMRNGVIAVDVLSANARFEHREPALTAVVSHNDTSQRNITSAQNKPPTKQETEPFRVLGPVFENDQVPLEPIACSATRSSLVSAFHGMKLVFGDHRIYQSLEAGLHIFEELRVPCDGILREWSFLAPSSKHHFIYGLNLAVFRPLDLNETTFQIVNATRIGVAKITPKIAGKWISYPLPAESRFAVQEGDYLGFYYNQFRTMSQFLTIATKNDDDDSIYRTWVFEYDKKIIDSSLYNKTINVKNSITTRRRPALAAKIGQPIFDRIFTSERKTTTTESPPIELPTSRRITSTTRQPPSTVTPRPIIIIATLANDTLILSNSNNFNKSISTTTDVDQHSATTTQRRRPHIWLNVINSGKSTCTAIQTNTSIYEFDDAEGCKLYIGDNRKECKVEAAADGSGFGVCVSSNSDCSIIGAIQVNLHRAATYCYTSINRNYRTCLHEDGDLLYCSPVTAKSKTCFAKNTECLDYIVNNSYAYDG